MSSLAPHLTSSYSQFWAIFDAALKAYAQKTGTDLSTHPLAATLEACDSPDKVLDVLQEQAHAFNQYQNGEWKVQLMRRLKPIVDILLGLSTSGVFGEGIGLQIPFAKSIFAGVGLLLSAAKGVSNSYDALIELFECFEHYLGRLDVFTEIPSSMRGILVNIMVELLAVLALAMQQIKQGRFKKFAKKLLGENDVEMVLQRLDRLTMEESRMTAAQTMEVVYGLFNNMKTVMDDGKASIDNIRGALVEMQQISEGLNKMKRDQLQEKIQKWLSPPDPSINHNVACEAHHAGTAAWFLEDAVYNEWKTAGSLMWMHGKPGSGKTVLCSSIIKDIEHVQETGLVSVAYHYCDFKDTGKQDRRSFLSSVLNQLCTWSHRGYDVLSSLYEKHANGLRQPSDGDLIQCLKNVLSLPGQGRVYIIMDALDECPNKPGIPSPREKVLHLVKELVDLRHPDVRICITSRPEADIRMDLDELASHTVSLHNEGGQSNDIINFVKSFVESDAKMRRWRVDERQMVIDSLSRNADGMFRWVVCQLDTLRRCFPPSIQRALNEMPMTLDETYERILLEIDREKREHAIHLLQCLAISRRPLRAKELAEVLAIRRDAGDIPQLNVAWRPGDAVDAVLSACSSLVTAVELGGQHDDGDECDSRIIQFSHYSVKEYLTSERLSKSGKGEISQYYISLQPAHTILAQICISTLLQLDSHAGNITNSFPLVDYAAQNWFHHARCNGVAPRIQDGMQRLFDPYKTHLAIWVSIHDIDDPIRSLLRRPPQTSHLSPLYYAALCGIHCLVEHLVFTHRQDPNRSRGKQGTPLHVAVLLGHAVTARFFLGHSADVNSRDSSKSTPLHIASGRGNLDIVQLLLDRGADINALDCRGGSPLRVAWRSQKYDLVELLIKRGADVNFQGPRALAPLHEALESRRLDLAQLLLSHGADVNALDHRGDSPLHKALRSRKFDIVEFLVRGGVDVNIRDKLNSTPLHRSLENGHLDIAQLLLSHGADIKALDRSGELPLQKALRSRNVDVVKLLLTNGADVSATLPTVLESGDFDMAQLLLSHGADINALDRQGYSPLHKALQSRNAKNRPGPNLLPLHSVTDDEVDSIPPDRTVSESESEDFDMVQRPQKSDVVKFLLTSGADVNVRGRPNLTPLHTASESGDLEMVQLLLSHGADINALDHQGYSPLQKALRSRNFDIAKFLLTSVADVNTRDRSNLTPLHTISGSGELGMAQLLLGHGADVNARDVGGLTPLHWASLKGYYSMAKLLLRHGADVNARERRHRTPLHMASSGGSLEISRLLTEHGAEVDSRDDQDLTPFSTALRFGHRKLARFLSE